MNKFHYSIIALVIFLGVLFLFLSTNKRPSVGVSTNSVPIENSSSEQEQEREGSRFDTEITLDTRGASLGEIPFTTREIRKAESITLPLGGSAPESAVKHSIPIEEIRQGCLRQDCIPSVDSPEFVSVDEANVFLNETDLGIALSYNGVNRFYPFIMLVTREIVNDMILDDPILVTYCPLCGTGIVFDREIDGKTYEFGVSGMLWQSNLLMYNRAEDLRERNLWSQVLGEAVVGSQTGRKLSIIPSNIMRYSNWRETFPTGEVLFTGATKDPYNGQYYEVARNFAPNFDETESDLDPSTYVVGVEIDGVYKAYPLEKIEVGDTKDKVGEYSLVITKNDIGEVSVKDIDGSRIPTVTGFWFSWKSAHPDTLLME